MIYLSPAGQVCFRGRDLFVLRDYSLELSLLFFTSIIMSPVPDHTHSRVQITPVMLSSGCPSIDK